MTTSVGSATRNCHGKDNLERNFANIEDLVWQNMTKIQRILGDSRSVCSQAGVRSTLRKFWCFGFIATEFWRNENLEQSFGK